MSNKSKPAAKDSNGVDDKIDDDAKEDRPSHATAKYLYQVLLIASLIGNGALALRSAWNTERLNAISEQKTTVEIANAKLQAEKTSLDTQLLRIASTPSLSLSRLRYALRTFAQQQKKGALVPFLSNVKEVRIVQNEAFFALERGLKALHRGTSSAGTVEFLMVANVGNVPALSVVAKNEGGAPHEMGDLLPNSVLLIPIEYTDGKSTTIPAKIALFQFDSSTANGHLQQQIPVPPPTVQSWVPTLDEVRGIGRALTTDDDTHLLDAVSPSSRKPPK